MSQHLVPFARHDGPGTLLAIVPRDPDTWLSTWILLPPWAPGSVRYRHMLTRDTVEATKGYLPAAAVFRTSPVALLWADTSAKGAVRDGA